MEEKEGVLGGLTVSNLTSTARSKYKIPSEVRQGVVIDEVAPDSRAAMEGLRSGDVIMEINRSPIDSVSKFNQTYRAARGKVLILVYREGATLYMLLSK
jgi:serine protease Do